MPPEEMKPIERVLTAAEQKEPDRVPTIPLIVNAAARVTGIMLSEYAKNGTKRAEAQLAAQEKYGHDGVTSGVDLCHEVEAMGCKIRFPEDNIPSVEEHVIKKHDDLSKLSIPDPETDARMPEMLGCLKKLRKEVGDRMPVIGVGVGPFTIASQLRGLERLLMDMRKRPDWVKKLTDFTTEVGIRYGTAQLKAGAHVLVTLEPSADALILSTKHFDEFVQPNLKKYSKAFAEAGGIWLPYMAGDTTPVLERFVEAGAPALGVDWFVDLVDAKRRVGDKLLLFGNIRPLLILYGTPEEVAKEAEECIRKAGKGGGFCLSSGCEVPPESPPENIKTIVDTAKKFTYPLKF